MFVVILALGLIGLASAAHANNEAVVTFPSKGPRKSNYVTYRFLNTISNPPSSTTFAAGTNLAYSNVGQLQLFFVAAAEEFQISNFASPTGYEFQQLDSDQDQTQISTFNVVLRDTNGDTLTSCSVSNDGERKSIRIVQTITDTDSDNGVCSTDNSVCDVTVTARSASFSCSVDSESFTPVRNCVDVTATFSEEQTSTCDLLLERKNVLANPNERIVRDVVATEQLEFTSEYDVVGETNGAFPAADFDVKRYTTIIRDSGTTVTELETGYLNILNAAFVLADDDDDANTIETAQNSLFVVICNNSGCTQVVDHNGLQQGSFYGWLELEVGAYQVEFYGASKSATTFQAANALGSANVQIDARNFVVVAARTNGVNSVSVEEENVSPPIGSLDVSTGIDGTAQTLLINYAETSFVLAQPNADCCNRLSGSAINDGDRRVISSDELAGTVQAYESFTNCGDQGAPIGQVTLPNAPTVGTIKCTWNVVFVLGKSVQRTVNSCGSPSGNPLACSTTPSSSSQTITTDLDFVEDSNGNLNAVQTFDNQPITLEIPTCACDVTPVVCNAVCEETEFDNVNDNINQIQNALASLSNTINTVNANVVNGNANVFGALSGQLSNIEGLVEDVESGVDDVEDEVEEAISAADSAADEANDAKKAALKAFQQAKIAKNLLRELHPTPSPTPPPTPVAIP